MAPPVLYTLCHTLSLPVARPVVLAVGEDDAALPVEMADVAGVQPRPLARLGRIGNEDALGLGLVAPIALHDQFAAHQYLAVVGDPDLGVHQRRADGVHLEPCRGAVATDHRPRLGLPIDRKSVV